MKIGKEVENSNNFSSPNKAAQALRVRATQQEVGIAFAVNLFLDCCML